MRFNTLRDLSLLLLFFAFASSAQEREPLDASPALLLHSSKGSADVSPEDLNPEYYTVHHKDDDLPPGTEIAVDGTDVLTSPHPASSK